MTKNGNSTELHSLINDTSDSALDEIAEEIGTVDVTDAELEERSVEKGEQFGYEKRV